MIQRLYESNQPTSIMENEQALTVTLIIILFLLINAISALVVGFDSARHSVKQQTHGRWRYSPTAWATAGAIFGPATLLIYLVNRRQILPKPRETKFPLPHEVRGMFLATSVPLAFAVFAFMLIPMDRCALPSSTQAIREILMETKVNDGAKSVEFKTIALMQLGLWKQDSLCRTEADVQWRNGETYEAMPLWYYVHHKDGNWRRELNGPMSIKLEEKYQRQNSK
jgi:multisubunit Na+/H+ antiporter MnhB subunit